MKDLFTTKEEQEAASAAFKSLLGSPGWKVLSDIVNANTEFLKNRILNGVENETTDSINRLRDKLKVYQEVLGTPQMIIERFTPRQEPDTQFDPYDTPEDIEKKRK